ncbi:hypothetical protein ACFQS7_05000 [Dankookia sp. GCM10030260]|uniref:hypothetical protein n=1 Tax=Dankookia sp. GCM10030260 TaxID=3273390 RepID=UPI003613574E
MVEVAVAFAFALNAASGAFMLQKDLARGGGRVITVLHGVYAVNSRLVQAADPVAGERPGLAPAPGRRGRLPRRLRPQPAALLA